MSPDRVIAPKTGLPHDGVIENRLGALCLHDELDVHSQEGIDFVQEDETNMQLVPVDRGSLERVEPVGTALGHSELEKDTTGGARAVDAFNKGLEVDSSKARQQRWAENLFTGPNGLMVKQVALRATVARLVSAFPC